MGWQGLGWLRQQQPSPRAWPHTSPCGIFFILGHTLSESWWFFHWESLHRGRLTMKQRQFWEFCTGCNRILFPALMTPPIFKVLSKSEWKPTKSWSARKKLLVKLWTVFWETLFLPFLAVLSGFINFYSSRLITVRYETHLLLVYQARCSSLPVDCFCTLHASSWSFVLQQGEGMLVKSCSLPVTPATSHLLH